MAGVDRAENERPFRSGVALLQIPVHLRDRRPAEQPEHAARVNDQDYLPMIAPITPKNIAIAKMIA